MNVMFKEIRHDEFEKIKMRIRNNPAVVNEVYTGKRPLKDIGQSPLQVAIKAGKFEIIDLLIDNGADVDFMENRETQPPDTDNYYFMPMPLINDAIIGAFNSICYGAFERSDKQVRVIERLLKQGANPNKETAPHPRDKITLLPLDTIVHEASYIFRYNKEYRDKAQECLRSVLTLFREYNVDFDLWLDRKFSPYYAFTNRAVFIDGSEKPNVDCYDDIIPIIQEFYFPDNKEKTI